MSEVGKNTKPIVTIVAALNCEAKPWVDLFGLQKRCDKPFWHYVRNPQRPLKQSDVNIEVVISGIGSTAMATAVGWVGAHSSRERVWLNLGIAGHASAAIGSLHRVHSVVNANTRSKYYPPLVAKWRGTSSEIVAVDAPSSSYPENALIDMESHVFFQAANMFSPAELVQSLKVVSDNTDQGFEGLNAAKISALMTPHLQTIRQFCHDLAALIPDRQFNHPWSELMPIKASHSQRLQLQSLFKRAWVLGLDRQVASLKIDSATPIRVALETLRELLDESAPILEGSA